MKDRYKNLDIVCLSYLTWEETLFQRPQQIMKMMSMQHHRVVYVSFIGTRAFLSEAVRGRLGACYGTLGRNLTYVNVPYLPFTQHVALFRWLMNAMLLLVARFLAWRRGFKNVCLWLYHPGLFPFARLIPHGRLVYDCMDQFEAFEGARASDTSRERRLLEAADVVFTGGKTLQRAKAGVNPRTFCFPSGVEFEHFNKAMTDTGPAPEDISQIPKPILGYFGAVDERIDFDLIHFLCEKRRDWSIVFLGPLVGFDVPPVRQPNFHYLGKKPYAELPSYLKAFDVCLMPFVDSFLTRHTSPTKTPEYLAGGKPVVSTPVPDVVEDYGDVVRIGREYEEFQAQVEAALADDRYLGRQLQGRAEARAWSHVAEGMDRLIRDLPAPRDGALG